MSGLGPVELVVFDVDGTLQDTFQWWPRVVRAGVARCAELWGFEPELPDDETACAVVGQSQFCSQKSELGPFQKPLFF